MLTLAFGIAFAKTPPSIPVADLVLLVDTLLLPPLAPNVLPKLERFLRDILPDTPALFPETAGGDERSKEEDEDPFKVRKCEDIPPVC